MPKQFEPEYVNKSFLVYRPNTKHYETPASVCKMVKHASRYYTNFIADHIQETAVTEIPVTTEECQRMRTYNTCSHGTLVSYQGLSRTNNTHKINFPYPILGSFSWNVQITYNCILYKSKVFARYGTKEIQSPSGDLSRCEYQSGECTTPSGATVMWKPVLGPQCRFIKFRRFTGSLRNKIWVTNANDFALSFYNSTELIEDCGATFRLTDQGYAVLEVEMKRRLISRPPRDKIFKLASDPFPLFKAIRAGQQNPRKELMIRLLLGDESLEIPRPTLQIADPYFRGADADQLRVLQASYSSPAVLVQAGAGTGKTCTIVALVCSMLNQNPTQKILVSAPTNFAIRNVIDKLKRMGSRFTFLHFVSENQTAADGNGEYSDHQFEAQARRLLTSPMLLPNEQDLLATYLKQRPTGAIKETDALARTAHETVAAFAAPQIISATTAMMHVIADTLASSAAVLILDEACGERENVVVSLVSRLPNLRQLFFVGDNYQLQPRPLNSDLYSFGEASVLMIMHNNTSATHTELWHNYRSHPILTEIASRLFYNSELIPAARASERARFADSTFPLPISAHPLLLLHCGSKHEQIKTSLCNHGQIAMTVQLIRALLAHGVPIGDITVLPLYLAQVKGLQAEMASQHMPVNVSTVDAFQGKEANVVVIVTTNTSFGAGGPTFMDDIRRLTVLFTRAIHGLIIIGEFDALKTRPNWQRAIHELTRWSPVLSTSFLTCAQERTLRPNWAIEFPELRTIFGHSFRN